MLLYSLTIALSAFLLFELQPIIAKSILPWFGGTSAVWSTCMLFFQVVLLLGYLYAHWLHRTFGARRQAIIHSVVLAASLALLPVLPNPAWKSTVVAHPSLRILALLTVTVGLPYFLLSSTSPLLQAWYARTHKRGMPYRLFALSNAASLAALLSYPFLIEPNLATRLQGILWSAAYAGFAATCALTAWRTSLLPEVEAAHAARRDRGGCRAGLDGPPAVARPRVLGFGTSAGGDHAPHAGCGGHTVPLDPAAHGLPAELHPVFRGAELLPARSLRSAAGALARLHGIQPVARTPGCYGCLADAHHRMSIGPSLVVFALALFVCCMVCHGELARLKPHPRHLTGFYVLVSLGGATGGLFVGLVAPNFFRAYYEFPIGLAFCACPGAIVLCARRGRAGRSRLWPPPWPATCSAWAPACTRWWTDTGW